MLSAAGLLAAPVEHADFYRLVRDALRGEGNVDAARTALERISRLRNEEVLAGLKEFSGKGKVYQTSLDKDNETALRKVVPTIKKLPRKLSNDEALVVQQRLKALGGNPKLPFFAVLSQGFPRLVTVSRTALVEQHDMKELPLGVHSRVMLNDDAASVPDLVSVELLIAKALDQAA